jgi:alpha-beta hydrolase superfamily lysophospholipase
MEFYSYAEAGYDVYIYDYRGYGRSEGKRRLKAIVNDYKAIVASLNAGMYEQKLVYAMSLGGIVFLNTLTAELEQSRIIIDSSPSRLSNYGCPTSYDPINHLPLDCNNIMFIVGQRDRVVTPAMSQEMIEKAQQRGAHVLTDPEYAHPFMDSSWSVHQNRMNMIKEYLLQNKDSK